MSVIVNEEEFSLFALILWSLRKQRNEKLWNSRVRNETGQFHFSKNSLHKSHSSSLNMIDVVIETNCKLVADEILMNEEDCSESGVIIAHIGEITRVYPNISINFVRRPLLRRNPFKAGNKRETNVVCQNREKSKTT